MNFVDGHLDNLERASVEASSAADAMRVALREYEI